MSFTEILLELPLLKAEEREILVQRLHELEVIESAETPEMLAAIDEADVASEENDISAEEIRLRVTQWATSK